MCGLRKGLVVAFTASHFTPKNGICEEKGGAEVRQETASLQKSEIQCRKLVSLFGLMRGGWELDFLPYVLLMVLSLIWVKPTNSLLLRKRLSIFF